MHLFLTCTCVDCACWRVLRNRTGAAAAAGHTGGAAAGNDGAAAGVGWACRGIPYSTWAVCPAAGLGPRDFIVSLLLAWGENNRNHATHTAAAAAGTATQPSGAAVLGANRGEWLVDHSRLRLGARLGLQFAPGYPQGGRIADTAAQPVTFSILQTGGRTLVCKESEVARNVMRAKSLMSQHPTSPPPGPQESPTWVGPLLPPSHPCAGPWSDQPHAPDPLEVAPTFQSPPPLTHHGPTRAHSEWLAPGVKALCRAYFPSLHSQW